SFIATRPPHPYASLTRRSSDLVEVNNRGTEIASLVMWTASPGLDVTLTIDPQLQRLAEDVLADSLKYVNEDRLRVGLPLEETIRSEEHTSELQSRENLVCRLLL